MLKDTLKYQKKYGFDIGQNNVAWNNEADAFRHAYMQSLLNKKYGSFLTNIMNFTLAKFCIRLFKRLGKKKARLYVKKITKYN